MSRETLLDEAIAKAKEARNSLSDRMRELGIEVGS